MSPVRQTHARTDGCRGCHRRGDQLFAFANGKSYCTRCAEQVRGELHIQPLDSPALDHALSAAQGPSHRHDDGTDDGHGRAPEATAYEEPQQAPQQAQPARPSPLQPRTHNSGTYNSGTHSSGHQSPVESTEQTVATDESEDTVPTQQEAPSAPQEPRSIEPQSSADPLEGVLAEERHRIEQRRVELEQQIELIEAELEMLALRLEHVESLLSPDAHAA